MKIVVPTTIDDTNLTSSNVSATDHTAWSNSTTYSLGDIVQYDVTGSHHNYESLVGSSSTVIITIATPAVITWASHGLPINTPVTFSTTGALPTGITAGTVYYVLAPTTNSFNIAATVAGAAIATSGTQSGTQTCKDARNLNVNPINNPSTWLDLGATNRYSMFDQSVQTQTINAGSIVTTFTTQGYVDTIVLLNITASSVRVQMVYAGITTVYDNTIDIRSSSGVTNWWRYFFTPIDPQSDIVFGGLPFYANCTFTVTITASSGNAGCGALLAGLSRDISSTNQGVEQGAKLSIVDYSLKQVDSFGNYTIKQRAFNRKANWTVYVNGKDVDGIYRLLSDRRAIPTVYIGGSNYGTNIIYGFYKSFEVDISYIDMPAVCTLELESIA